MRKLGRILRKSTRIASRIIGGEAVIVLPAEGYVIALNTTATSIWKAIDGRKTIEDIISAVVQKYDVGEKKAREDVKRFLKDLQRKKIVFLR